jgi:hypothetical protein
VLALQGSALRSDEPLGKWTGPMLDQGLVLGGSAGQNSMSLELGFGWYEARQGIEETKEMYSRRERDRALFWEDWEWNN